MNQGGCHVAPLGWTDDPARVFPAQKGQGSKRCLEDVSFGPSYSWKHSRGSRGSELQPDLALSGAKQGCERAVCTELADSFQKEPESIIWGLESLCYSYSPLPSQGQSCCTQDTHEGAAAGAHPALFRDREAGRPPPIFTCHKKSHSPADL